MAYFTILEKEKTPAGKVLVRVDLIDESLFFKFQHEPTQDDVDWEVIAFLTEIEKQRNLELNNGTTN